MSDIYEEVVRLKHNNRSSALATIVRCAGSSPQSEGAKMLVRDDGTTLGTLGGGCLERDVVEAALLALEEGTPVSVPFSLTEREGGLVCGGEVTVFIDPIIPEPQLIILGAGHVGKALARAARHCGFRVTIVDNRPEFASMQNVPEATEVVVSEFSDIFSKVVVEKRSFIAIATRGHNFDLEAVRAALRTEAAYVGLLGSRRKKALLMGTLVREGFSADDVARISIPIGLPIGAVTPEEIAVSIMAEIITHRRAHAKPRIGNPSRGGCCKEDEEAKAVTPSAQ